MVCFSILRISEQMNTDRAPFVSRVTLFGSDRRLLHFPANKNGKLIEFLVRRLASSPRGNSSLGSDYAGCSVACALADSLFRALLMNMV